MWSETETKSRRIREEDETGSDGDLKNVRVTEGGSSWHTAEGSSITAPPPSAGRSGELPPPSSLFGSFSCYVTNLDKEPEEGSEDSAVYFEIRWF